MSNIFEQAAKEKVRFGTTKGQLTVENLWDLSVDDLDTLAKAVNKRVKEQAEESFIPNKTVSRATKESRTLALQLDLLKHVITVKSEEADKAKQTADRRAKLAQLKELAANKSTEALASKSLDEITQMINDLEKE
jgi:hypothetical protein